jgi:hypothetical protein
MLIQPSTEFISLSEAAVLAALQDPDSANPVAAEVARLVAGYAENFRSHIEKLGRIPDKILMAKPTCPIEAVAMGLVLQTTREELARSPSGSRGTGARTGRRRARR